MICGNCKNPHGTAAQVRACYDAKTEPAKPQQLSLAHMLYRERDPSQTCLEELTREQAEEAINSATKSGISQIIEDLQGRPARRATEPLTDGYYKRKDGSIWKAYISQNDRLICKELEVWQDDVEGELSWHHEWTYRGAAARFLSAATKLTLEEAKQFGSIYGFCCVCGRTLTNEVSVAEGIGPVCSGRLS